MIIAGGVIGIIAGVFAIFAAISTLFIGGLGSAFDSEGAKTVIGLGWGGMFFSFAVIVSSALSFAKPKKSGIAMIVCSVGGIFLGGTLVAIMMVLSLVGGILVCIGAKNLPAKVINQPEEVVIKPSEGSIILEKPEPAIENNQPFVQKYKKVLMIVGIVFVLIIGLSVASNLKKSDKVQVKPEYEQIQEAMVSDISPYELGSIFNLMSDYTNIQRENKGKEITGKIVSWDLPVFEVKREGKGYKIQTSSSNVVGTFVHIIVRNDNERNYIENLKTGEYIKFKGKISGTTLRNINIDPAILVQNVAAAPAPAPAPAVPPPVAIAPTPAPAAPVASPTHSDTAARTVGQQMTFTPSFDCAKASTGPERLICSNKDLAEADVRLAQLYRTALGNSKDKASLKREQINWMKNQRDACSDSAVMLQVYQDRIAQLSQR